MISEHVNFIRDWGFLKDDTYTEMSQMMLDFNGQREPLIGDIQQNRKKNCKPLVRSLFRLLRTFRRLSARVLPQ